MKELYLVGDYTYLDDDGEETETITGKVSGNLLIDHGIWDYLTYVPEGEEDSMFSAEVCSILEPYLSENFSSLLTIYMPDYLSETYSADDYYGLLAVTTDYEMIRVNAESIIRDYLYNFMPEPFPAFALDGTKDRFLFVNTGLSYIYNVTLSDLVSYIKSH
jgi:hypothetical protein